jgi:hypothetical protein
MLVGGRESFKALEDDIQCIVGGEVVAKILG